MRRVLLCCYDYLISLNKSVKDGKVAAGDLDKLHGKRWHKKILRAKKLQMKALGPLQWTTSGRLVRS